MSHDFFLVLIKDIKPPIVICTKLFLLPVVISLSLVTRGLKHDEIKIKIKKN